MSRLLADSFTIGGQTIQGPLGNGMTDVASVVNRVVTYFLIPIGAVILFLVLIWGGYDFLMSQGSPDKIKSGRAKITAGLIGFVMLVVAYLAAKLVAYTFNLGQSLF